MLQHAKEFLLHEIAAHKEAAGRLHNEAQEHLKKAYHALEGGQPVDATDYAIQEAKDSLARGAANLESLLDLLRGTVRNTKRD